MAKNNELIVFSCGNRSIFVSDTGKAAFDRALVLTFEMYPGDNKWCDQFPSYPMVMLGLRTHDIYRFIMKTTDTGMEFQFSFSYVPYPDFMDDAINVAIERALKSVGATK